jgi:D-arabinose 1-dehydrogenase-like Zn-dependent alcohol dehydrogenase
MGHEGVGVIEKMHPSCADKGFKVGDKVGMLYIVDCCFECEACSAHGSQCTNPNEGGAKIMGLTTDGFFAEYSLTDWENVIHLPEELPMEKMSPLFCAGLTGECFHVLVLTQYRFDSVHQRSILSTNVSLSPANG